MRILFLALALFALFPLSDATFQRPWSNQTWLSTNPYISIYGFELWFDLPHLHQTMESISNDSLNQISANGSTESHIASAQKSIGKADTDLYMCYEKLLEAAAGIPISFFDSSISTFSGITYCTRYRSDWKGAVDNILFSIEDSEKAADDAVAKARAAYDKVVFAGLCDGGYVHGGSENCAEFFSAFSAVDGRVLDGKYGKYTLLRQDSALISAELRQPAPDLSESTTMLGLVWTDGGIISTFLPLQSLASDSFISAQTDFNAFYQGALSKRMVASKKMEMLGSERLDMIDRAPASFELRKPGTVSETFFALEKEASNLSGGLDAAKILSGRQTQRNYLASSVMLAADADSSYTQLLADLDSLDSDARDAISQQKKEAEDEISRTGAQFLTALPSPQGSGQLEQAKSLAASAPSLGTLGERFAAYSRAAAMARAARNSRSLDDEAEIRAALTGLEDAIAQAEKDGINVESEKVSLMLLRGMTSSDIRLYIDDAMASIVSKARAKYEDDLLSSRTELKDELSLAGPQAQTINDEFLACEQGIVKDDALVFPDALGNLAKLKGCYANIKQELSAYMSTIVGNSMSVRASVLVGKVDLDKPVETTLDLVLNNNRDYYTDRAEVRVSLDSSADFLYSDIVSGKEDVESVRFADGGKTIILVMRNVEPFETFRVIFRKSGIIAHTLSVATVAEGIGNDAAFVSSRIDFELEREARLSIPASYGEALIDGSTPGKTLTQGTHVLRFEAEAQDAYSEAIGDIKAYASGQNSRVEYTVTIIPNMDLVSVPVTLDSINDSRITSFQAVCASGCRISSQKRLSDTQYSVVLEGLKKGLRASLAVSYTVEHLDTYVEDQIRLLDNGVLCPDARAFIDDAKSCAASGDMETALELIEKAKAAQKGCDKESAKDDEKSDAISTKIQDEISQIKDVLAAARKEDSLNTSFMSRLEARKTELEKILNESGDADPGAKLAILSKTDTEWLDGEVGALKKNLSKQYNDLKERFFIAGNSTTPQEFLDFEASFNKLDTGGKLEYGVEAMSRLEAVKSLVRMQELRNSSGKEGLLEIFWGIKDSAESILESYRKEAASAKGTEFASLFTENDKTVDKAISDAEAFATSDPKRFWLKIDEINKSGYRMQGILSSLKQEAEAKLSLIEGIFSQKDLDDSQRKQMGLKIDALRSLLAGGQLANSLRSASALMKELDSIKPKDGNGPIVLGLTALAVLGGVGFYMMKQQKEPKKPRKLASISEGPRPPEPVLPSGKDGR